MPRVEGLVVGAATLHLREGELYVYVARLCGTYLGFGIWGWVVCHNPPSAASTNVVSVLCTQLVGAA